MFSQFNLKITNLIIIDSRRFSTMKRNVVLGILQYIVWLPSRLNAIPVNEETLQNLLDKYFLLPTDDIITLREVYGSDVNVHNFNPGEKMLEAINPPSSIVPQITLTHIKDIPAVQHTDVYFKYIQEAMKTVSENNFVLIKGIPQTGKTRVLRMLEYKLLTQSKPVLVIYVDLPKILNPDAAHITNSDDLLGRSMPADVADFVKNVADVNPAKVKILMDNIDKISIEHQQKIFPAISELHSRRIGTVISSTTNIERSFNQWKMNPAVVEIPQLSEMDFERLAHKYWEQKLGEEFVEVHSERIRQYTKALRLMVFETPLPRFIVHVQNLLSAVMKKSVQSFPSLEDYIQYPEKYPSPRSILKSSDYVNFNKGGYYFQILSKFETRLPLGFEIEIIYGIQALKMLLQPLTPIISQELQERIKWSQGKISKNGPHMYNLMIFTNGEPVDFVHPEYKRYYAAILTINSFSTPIRLIETFKTIILDPKYIMVAEFINSDMRSMIHFDSLIETIFLQEIAKMSPLVTFQIADNLISHRLDSLSSKMLKALGEVNILHAYLDYPRILESKNKYSFGMLSEVRNIDSNYHIPRKTPWIYSGSRMEMIFNLQLTRSLEIILGNRYTANPNVALIAAAKKPRGAVKILNANPRRNYPVEVLNRAMYESLKALGPEAIHNMRALRARGAQPTTIDVEGRTLAHEAARWHNKKLLKVIHGEFLVSLDDAPDKNGRTILFELLDYALPSNAYVQENAWESISYLAEYGYLNANEQLIAHFADTFRSYAPSLDRVVPAFQRIITYDLEDIASKKDLTDTLGEYIPIEDVDVPREILSIRRLLMTKKCIKTMMEKPTHSGVLDFVTVAELVLSHKPIMGSFEFDHYQNAMKYLLTKKIRPFNIPQLERVSIIIAKNMYMAADFIKITQMIRNDVALHEPQIIRTLKQTYGLRSQHRLPTVNIDESSVFEYKVVATVYDGYPEIKYTNLALELAQIENNLRYSSQQVAQQPDLNMYICDI